MAMATDKHTPKWRRFVIWSALGTIVCALAKLGVSSLRADGTLGTIFRSQAVSAKVGLALILSAAVVGLSMRNSPPNARNIRNFLIWSAVAIAIAAFARWGFGALGADVALGTMGISEKCAAAMGAVFVALSLLVMGVRAGARFVEAERADDLRRHWAELSYAASVTAAWGAALIVLALTQPGGIVPPSAALATALALSAVSGLLCLALWRHMDELKRALSQESTNWAFYLLLAVGGGWAMLAHLGFAARPAPLDWLTMFSGFMLVASFIVTGRRGLLRPH